MSQSAVTAAGQTFYSGLLLANFFEIPAQYPGCATSVLGACTISDCSAAADAGTPPDGGSVSAGTLTFTGLADGGVMLAPMVTAASTGYFKSVSGRLFTAGSVLQLSSSGGVVPAFTATVVAPQSVVLTSPVCPQSMCGVSKAAGIPLTWTGGGAGSVVLQVLGAAGSVSCTFPAAAGAGTVPSAALSSLANGTATMLFSASASQTVQAGAFPVVVSASETTTLQATLAP